MVRHLHFAAALILFIILTQDLQVYPELMAKLIGNSGTYDPPAPGANAADFFAGTIDGQRIHFRRWGANGNPQLPIRTAILSHGNAGTMDDYYTIPRWLAGKGIATYVYDYRGYGLSTGWPTEQGIYQDVEAIWREAQHRDHAKPETTLVFGHSLGGGPSSYLAEKYNMAVLMTAATYTSVPERAALHPFFGRLAPFVWTNFPNRERISHLKDTCLIVLHAKNDDTMPFAMSQRLLGAYHGTSRALFAAHASAGHGDIIQFVPELAEPLLPQCRALTAN
ncbi:MAG: alpha/beta fold hydrolase [Acidobacteria bacterium]|nr:alpha/beta fold hydrolase [Acidobacteriota bacterium]